MTFKVDPDGLCGGFQLPGSGILGGIVEISTTG